MRVKFASRMLVTSALVLPLLATAAHAQTAAAPMPPPPAADPNEVESIIVTAQRRAQSLQETPVSVTALTGEMLEQRQVTNVLDVASQVPNLTIETVTGVGNAARVFLRGVGEDQAQFNADPAVGIYVDGVYYARTNGALFDFFDVERVEVLRGPQGALYGRNTPGGAVNVITRRPSQDFGASAEVLYGRFDRVEARGTITGPINDTLAASVSVLSKQRSGISSAPNLGRDVNDRDIFSLRASLAADFTENFRARLTYDATWDDSDAFVPTSIFAGRPSDIFVTQSGTPPEAEFRSSGVALHADWDIGDVTISSITAYRGLEQSGSLDNDGELRVISGFDFDSSQNQFSQELTASISRERLEAIIGLYYFDEYNEYDALTLIGSRPNPAVRIQRPDFSVQDTTSYAIFGQFTYALTPALNLTLGGRYTWDEKSFENDQPSVPAVFRAAKEWQDFSPKVVLDYELTDTVFLYASYAGGYKAGGFNRSNIRVVAETPYDEEKVTSYEAGIKTEPLGGRARLNLNGFYNEYTDLQLSTFDPQTGTTRRFNAAQATIKGLELEGFGRVADGLDVYGSLGYLDAQYDEFVDRIGTQLVDVSFRKLKGAPKWQGNLGFTYTRDLANAAALRFASEVSHRAKIYNNVANTEEIATEAITLLNASASYITPDERWTFTLAGKNLTDEEYISNGIFIGGFISAVYPAEPLTWTVSARYNF